MPIKSHDGDGVGVKAYTCYLLLVRGWQYPSIYYCDHHDVISCLAPLPANPGVIMNPCSMFYPHWSISLSPSISPPHLIQRIQTPLRNVVVFLLDVGWICLGDENISIYFNIFLNIHLCLGHSCLCLSRPIMPGRTRAWLPNWLKYFFSH